MISATTSPMDTKMAASDPVRSLPPEKLGGQSANEGLGTGRPRIRQGRGTLRTTS